MENRRLVSASEGITQPMSSVVEYVVEEVARQGHDVTTAEGWIRVSWLLQAWCYAHHEATVVTRVPADLDIIRIGRLIEPEHNRGGLRRSDVQVGGRVCPSHKQVKKLLAELCAHQRVTPMPPLDFYRALLEIHPFVDGNGRTGKVILNWLNGSLERPVFPPNDFWGRRS